MFFCSWILPGNMCFGEVTKQQGANKGCVRRNKKWRERGIINGVMIWHRNSTTSIHGSPSCCPTRLTPNAPHPRHHVANMEPVSRIAIAVSSQGTTKTIGTGKKKRVASEQFPIPPTLRNKLERGDPQPWLLQAVPHPYETTLTGPSTLILSVGGSLTRMISNRSGPVRHPHRVKLFNNRSLNVRKVYDSPSRPLPRQSPHYAIFPV